MLRNFAAMYSWRHAWTLVAMLQKTGYRSIPFLRRYWKTANFASPELTKTLVRTSHAQSLVYLTWVGMSLQVLAGLLLIILWKVSGYTGGELFGLALLISYPLVWAHVLALICAVKNTAYFLRHPKKLGRSVVCRILEHQVMKLCHNNNFKIVAVVGSIGKTSTKLAIAGVLEGQFKVRYQAGNYNDRVTVPLVFFGRKEPSLFNIVAWLNIFRKNYRTLRHKYPYEVVVLELGTDGPGFIRDFAYLPIDVAVVTAITPEHMEYFGTMDAVADEELTVFDFSDQVVVNGDDTPAKYLVGRRFEEYSLHTDKAPYHATIVDDELGRQELKIHLANGRTIRTHTGYSGEPGARFTLAAAAVADQLDMQPSEIVHAAKRLEPFAGRMNVLPGINDSILIDDTYNSSPAAAMASLDVLYKHPTKQRIAILGAMNELGTYSPKAHREVGAYCDPKKLSLVVTIGEDAKKYLAPVARKQGCTVHSFLSPYEAGAFVRSHLQPNAIVLAKGSQNKVFAEEALKSLLAKPADNAKLVRQSSSWLKQKQRQFSGTAGAS